MLTVVAFHSGKRSLPSFELRPEHFGHKIASSLGSQDIDFDTNPVFSKKYLLRGSDEAAVRELFGSEVIRFFEKHSEWCVEGQGEWMIFYREQKVLKPKDITTFLEEVTEFLCRIE